MRRLLIIIKSLVQLKAGPVIALSVTMKTVIIVSKCLRVTKFNNSQSWYEFHFKGVCAGEVLQKLVLQGKRDALKKGEEYLIYSQIISMEDGILRGIILKAKPLHECWDRS